MNEPYKLLIVDDSKMMRKAVANIFASDDRIQVAGEAANGGEALEIIPQINPDVVTLDVNMPVMDGLTTLKHMMIETPTPAVMLSTLTLEGASVTFDALKYGAVDFVPKPSKLDDTKLEGQEQMVARKVALAAEVEVEAVQYIRALPNTELPGPNGQAPCNNIVVMGAAEGGYGTLLKIVPHLRPDLPAAYLIMLYAASPHVDAFAHYLGRHGSVRVKRAADGLPLKGGVCYLAAGEEYVTVRLRGNGLSLGINPAPFTSISQRQGSINMLMFSAAEAMGDRATGVILSGAGDDGAEGLAEIIRSGGTAVVQDPKTCLYKEMAKSALDRCEPDHVITDLKIASAVRSLLSNRNGDHYKGG